MDLFTPEIQNKKPGRKPVIASGYGTDTPTIGDLIISRLRPFRFAIVTMLKKHGYNTQGVKFKILIPLFFNEFVSKEPVNVTAFANSTAFKIPLKEKTYQDLNDPKNMSQFSELNIIIDRIIDSFKQARIKKGILQKTSDERLMTDEELMQAKAFDIVLKKLETEATADHFITSGTFRKYIWFLFIAIVLIYVFK